MGITNFGLCYLLRRLNTCVAIVVASVLAGTTCPAQGPGDCGPVADYSCGGVNYAPSGCWSPNFAGQGFPALESFSAAGQPFSNPAAQVLGAKNGYVYPQVQCMAGPSACGLSADGVVSQGGAVLVGPGRVDSMHYGSMYNGSAYAVPGNCNSVYYNSPETAPTAFNANGYSLTGVNAANLGCGVLPVNRFYSGFEFLWMRAHFDQNVAMIIDPPVGNTLVPFDYDFNFTPRTWLGWQGCNGGGFRGTYWRFNDQAATERATAVAGATPVYLFVYGAGGNLTRNAYADLGETLVANHSLTLQALDLEATQRFGLGPLQCLVGAGVRLADMDQHLRGEVYDATNALWEVVTNDLSFQGAGPTASLQAWRPLGASRFSTYGGVRGALLYCETQQAIYEMKDGYANELVDVANATEILTNGEMSIGLQYTHCLGPRAQFFVRGSYEAQVWFDVGGPVDSHSTVALDGIGLATGLLY